MSHNPDTRELGTTGSSFMTKLAMLCVVVLIMSGLIVSWTNDAAPHRRPDAPGHVQQPGKRPAGKPSLPNSEPMEEGDRCD